MRELIEWLDDVATEVAAVDGAAVIIIRGADPTNLDQQRSIIDAIGEHFRALAVARGLPSDTPAALVTPLIAFLDEGQSIETSNELQMAHAGWQRIPT